MNIRPLMSRDESLAKNFLQKHITSSLFILSNMKRAGLDYKDEVFHGEYWASFTDKGEINGIIAHYWNGNIMVQAPDNNALEALNQTLSSVITRPVMGFLGPDEQVDHIISNAPFTLLDYAKDEREDLYRLDLTQDITYPTHINASIKNARDMDKDLYLAWIRDYDIEALGYDRDRANADAQNRYDRMVSGDDMWTLFINNNPVCLCGVNARVDDTVQIGPVWTPPELRGQGFARTLVGMTLELLKEQGIKQAILFTSNPAAVKVYEAVGFQKIGGYKLSLLRKAMALSS